MTTDVNDRGGAHTPTDATASPDRPGPLTLSRSRRARPSATSTDTTTMTTTGDAGPPWKAARVTGSTTTQHCTTENVRSAGPGRAGQG